MVISLHSRDPQVCLVMSCQLLPIGSFFLKLSFLSFQLSFFLFSSSLHSSFFIFSSTYSLNFFILSFIFSDSSETNFSRNKLFKKQTFQFKQYPQTFQFKQSPKSLTHHSILRLGSEFIFDGKLFWRENCWSVWLRSIQRVLRRWRWMTGLADEL